MRQVLVVFEPRSGTHLMRRTLNLHSQISCSDEILQPGRMKSLRQNTAREAFYTWHNAQGVPVSCALMHRTNYEVPMPEDGWAQAEDMHEKFVRIYRANMLKQFLSSRVAMGTRNWSSLKARRGKLAKIHLNLKDFEFWLNFVNESRGHDADFQPQLVIEYQSFIENFKAITKVLQDFIGVEHEELEMTGVKQEGRSLEEAISNFDEVARFVSERGHEDWLI